MKHTEIVERSSGFWIVHVHHGAIAGPFLTEKEAKEWFESVDEY